MNSPRPLTRCLPLLLKLIGWLSAGAQTPHTAQTYAVVVGISDYRALTLRTGDLRFADEDARRVAAFLTSRAGGSVRPTQLRLLTNAQATKANIRQALRLFARAQPRDRILLYFSGHGGANSFVPYDVRADEPQSLLTYADIKAAFRASRAGVKLCIADACGSGNLTRPTRSVPRGSPQKKISANVATDLLPPGSNVAMLLASRSTQVALEDRRLAAGAFTYFLLKGLRGDADRNADKIVTIKELHAYVVPNVRNLSSARQSPVFYGRFSDNLPLAYF